jgi:beta-barrel assembly-enhancing protease
VKAVRRIALAASALAFASGGAVAGMDPLPPPGYQPDISSEEAGLWMQVDKMEAAIKVAPNLVKNAALNAYVRDVVCKLAGDYCGSIRIYIVEDPEFNAFAMPNGALVVYTGLLLRTENEAQLAFVLGHEITHFLHRHTLQHLQMMVNTAGFLAVFGMVTAGAGAGGLGLLANTIGVGAIFANSRDEERDADANGFQLGVRNGYDPSQAPAIWRFMVAEDGVHEHKSGNMFLADHPASKERLDTLEKAAGAAVPSVPVITNVDAYRKATMSFLGRWIADELARGEPKESVVLFTRLTVSQSSIALYQYGLGEAYRHRNAKDDAPLALAAYRAALACSDPPAEAWRGIGLVAMKDGERVQAKDAFSQYRATAPDADDKAMIDFYLTQL